MQFHFRFWVIDCVETFSLLEKKIIEQYTLIDTDKHMIMI